MTEFEALEPKTLRMDFVRLPEDVPSSFTKALRKSFNNCSGSAVSLGCAMAWMIGVVSLIRTSNSLILLSISVYFSGSVFSCSSVAFAYSCFNAVCSLYISWNSLIASLPVLILSSGETSSRLTRSCMVLIAVVGLYSGLSGFAYLSTPSWVLAASFTTRFHPGLF